jgi:Zn-dependent protease with chaperone function
MILFTSIWCLFALFLLTLRVGIMVADLGKLHLSVKQPHLPDQLAAFGISGNKGSGQRRLFMTHPPLEDRIRALKNNDLTGA